MMRYRRYGSDARDSLREMYACDKLVKKYGGMFNFKGSAFDLREEICDEERPCPGLVLLYAKMGLHRYNLLQGTKFELRRVMRYVISQGGGCAIGCYYITLDAMDPAVGFSSLQTFETRISEEDLGRFILRCTIARIRGETTSGSAGVLLDHTLPEWPAENPFEKYYLVKDSEVQDNEWIRLYMELAVAITNNRDARDCGPYDLKIVKVAIDENGEGLNAINAILYIWYKDFYAAPLGKEYLDRFAIVRRRFDEDKGCFSLVGSVVKPNMDFQMKSLHL